MSSFTGGFDDLGSDCSKPLTAYKFSNGLIKFGPVIFPAIYNSSLTLLAINGDQIAASVTPCGSVISHSYLAVFNSTTQSIVKFPQIADGPRQGTFASSEYVITSEFDSQATGGRYSLYLNDIYQGQSKLIEQVPSLDQTSVDMGTDNYPAGLWVNGTDLYVLMENENCEFPLQSDCQTSQGSDRNSKWVVLKTPLNVLDVGSASVVSSGEGDISETENFQASPNNQRFSFFSSKYDLDNGDTFWILNNVGQIIFKKIYPIAIIRRALFLNSNQLLLDEFSSSAQLSRTEYLNLTTQTLPLNSQSLFKVELPFFQY